MTNTQLLLVMAGIYDEDVWRNPYFLRILNDHSDFLEKTVASKGVLCVPKYSIASNWSPSQADVLDHILLPPSDVVNDDDDSFITISNKVVQITSGKLVTKSGFATSNEIAILFTETFHTDKGGSYQVFCIDGLLNATVDISDSENSTHSASPPSSYRQCMELLWTHSGGSKTRDSLDKILDTFSLTYDRLEGETLRSIVDAANAHFTKAMQLLLKDSIVDEIPIVSLMSVFLTLSSLGLLTVFLKHLISQRRSIQQSPYYMDHIKMAVETYVMNSVHKCLFPVITATMASQDAEINKINRNLVDLRPSELGIRKIFSKNITPAKKELNSLNLYHSPMEKLLCLKRVTAALTRPSRSATKGKSKESVALMSTDDLLPILIFLIIKSEVPNWMANLVYMQHFHFSKSSDDDEFGFYLASVEAALEHIQSGNITNEIKPLKRDRWNSMLIADSAENSLPSVSHSLSRQCSYSALDELFKLVQEGNVVKVQEVLEQPYRRSEEVHRRLCHPLCSCDECDKMMSQFRSNSDMLTAYSRDSRGYTAMHVAAYYGQEPLIDLLIQKDAIVDTTDYLGLTPLHLACQRGLHNVILRLLHYGADIMATDNEGNTPLHFCCANGHEDCVRTLVCCMASLGKLEINLTNEFGDTALHLAAKWGYESIVKFLLENGADARIFNKRKHTPVSLAQNMRVQRWLTLAAQDSDSQMAESVHPRAASLELNGSTKSLSTTQEHTSSSQNMEGLNLYEPETLTNSQTTSLEPDTENEVEEEELFKAIIKGDIRQVKLYLRISSDGSEEDDDIQMSPSSLSLSDLCHPLCQCYKCIPIQKAIFRTGSGLNINSKTLSGFHAIHMAVLHNHVDVVTLLISCHADVNIQNHKRLAPLHLACCIRSILILDLLLKAGAKLNVCDINGNTPLLVAACSGFLAGVQTLIKMGANLNSTNHKGNTALHEALKRDNLDISTALISAGADPRIRNKTGKLPVDETEDLIMLDMLTAACCRLEIIEANATNNNVPTKQQMKGSDRQITIQELFAAFEEKDLHRLQSLALSIRSFDHKSGLRSTKTRDMSAPFLDAFK